MCKELAKANVKDSCEMAKARGTMCEGEETVCKGIAKGEWNATRKQPCARDDKVIAVIRGHLQEGCENAKLAAGSHVQGSSRAWGDRRRL